MASRTDFLFYLVLGARLFMRMELLAADSVKCRFFFPFFIVISLVVVYFFLNSSIYKEE